MKAKTSIRFFNKNKVRARWDDDASQWWYVAADLIGALISSRNVKCIGMLSNAEIPRSLHFVDN